MYYKSIIIIIKCVTSAGAQLKKNIRDLWWRDFVQHRKDCVGIDTPIIINTEGMAPVSPIQLMHAPTRRTALTATFSVESGRPHRELPRPAGRVQGLPPALPVRVSCVLFAVRRVSCVVRDLIWHIVCRADKLVEEHGVEGAGALSALQLEQTIKERDLKPSQCTQKTKPCTYTGTSSASAVLLLFFFFS